MTVKPKRPGRVWPEDHQNKKAFIHARVTVEDKEVFLRLGGTKWLEEQIKQARGG